jgi:hypothetical protein
MKTIPFRPQWLPTDAAASALGIHRRTLVRRARAGLIDTRPGEAGTVLYAIPGGLEPGAAPMAPSPDTTRAPQGETPSPAILLAALAEALVRAGRAEAERDAARATLANAPAELDTARAELQAERAAHARTLAAALALEAAHVKRGAILRRLAARIGARD